MNSKPIYRGYDRRALDAQMSLDGIRDLEGVLARRLRASEATRARRPHRRRIAYGARPEETLDVFPAETSGPAPVQMFVHGGFWRALDASVFSFVADGFAPRGAATVVIDYPLIPSVTLDEIVESCRAAVAWIHRNAASFGGDPERIHVSGNSAGGHLVAELMARDWPAAHGLPEDVVKGGCAISGLFELEPVRLSAQNDTLGFDEEVVARRSPMRRVPDAASPLILAVGGDETREFLDQTADYAAAWRRKGLPVEEIVVPGTNHVTVVLDAFADPESELNRAVRRQMGLDAG